MRRITGIFFMTAAMAIAVVAANPAADGNDYWPQWRGPLANGRGAGGRPAHRVGGRQEHQVEGRDPRKRDRPRPSCGATPFSFSPPRLPTSGRRGRKGRRRKPLRRRARKPARVATCSPSSSSSSSSSPSAARMERPLWQKIVREALPHEGWNPNATITWASSSPVTDGQMVYAYFGSRGLYALDLKGNVKWERDFGHMNTGGFGEGSSPALDGQGLVVNWDHEGESSSSRWTRRPARNLEQRARREDHLDHAAHRRARRQDRSSSRRQEGPQLRPDRRQAPVGMPRPDPQCVPSPVPRTAWFTR